MWQIESPLGEARSEINACVYTYMTMSVKNVGRQLERKIVDGNQDLCWSATTSQNEAGHRKDVRSCSDAKGGKWWCKWESYHKIKISIYIWYMIVHESIKYVSAKLLFLELKRSR